MSRPAPLLQAVGLHKAYAGKPALHDVSLNLYPGEMLALLGPNGAGKSTLMQLLTGLFTPDQGHIEVLGHNMQRHPARALAGLGVVFQQSALDLDLSVMANLLFHTDLHGFSRASARECIAEYLPMLGLENQEKTVVRQLSGGNRRKVELVRALLHKPRALLMDEATVGLDASSRQQLLTTVARLCREQGLGVLWITHLIEEVQTAHRLVLLRQGRVRFEGSAATLMAQVPSGSGSDFQAEVLRHLR